MTLARRSFLRLLRWAPVAVVAGPAVQRLAPPAPRLAATQPATGYLQQVTFTSAVKPCTSEVLRPVEVVAKVSVPPINGAARLIDVLGRDTAMMVARLNTDSPKMVALQKQIIDILTPLARGSVP